MRFAFGLVLVIDLIYSGSSMIVIAAIDDNLKSRSGLFLSSDGNPFSFPDVLPITSKNADELWFASEKSLKQIKA